MNCLQCTRYFSCKDPQKSVLFSCSSFSSVRSNHSAQFKDQEAGLLEDLLQTPIQSNGIIYRENDPLASMTEAEQREFLLEDQHSGFDVFKMVNDSLRADRIISPDIKVPEGDFAEAPNFYTWCASDKFLRQKPFISQAAIGTKLFAEYCPDCSEPGYLDNYNINDGLLTFENKVALLEHGVCPHCGKSRLHFLRKKKLNLYVELALCAGQRSGKSAFTAMLTSYLTHRYIKLERPNEVYGLLSSTTLQGVFVALTFGQAKDTLWDPFLGNLVDSPWFQDYHEMLTDVQRKYGGDELFKLQDSSVTYKHRRLSVYPAGPDKRILRGRTRKFGSVDELGWFPNGADASKNVKMNADEVYIAIERSLLTVRTAARDLVRRGFFNVPLAYFVNISSPSSVRDKIMELVRKGQGSRKLLGVCKPTWEMNPKVPRKALAEEFRKDPVTALRDYGAQPPLTNNPFIPSKDTVSNILGKKKNSVIINTCKYKSSDGAVELYGEVVNCRYISRPSILALDAGYSNNSFAFAAGHRGANGKPVVSMVGEIIPHSGMRINYSKLYSHLLSELFDYINIVKAVADRWNSLKVLADMEVDHAAERQIYSLTYSDLQMFKSCAEDQEITLPVCTTPIEEIIKYDQSNYPQCFIGKPMEHLILQLLTVQDTGSAVIKGDQLTDDIARAVMLLHQQLLSSANDELLEAPDKAMEPPAMDMSQFAVSRRYSGGGTASMAGGQNASAGSNLGFLKQRY